MSNDNWRTAKKFAIYPEREVRIERWFAGGEVIEMPLPADLQEIPDSDKEPYLPETKKPA
jgi:hypothetical protein